MRYRAVKVANIEEYLFGAIGDAMPVRPKWELHLVVPLQNTFLVILQTGDEVLFGDQIKARAEALK